MKHLILFLALVAPVFGQIKSPGVNGENIVNPAFRNAVLPSQASQSGKYLKTNGTGASWETATSDLTSGPVTSSGGVSAIADAALSIAKTSGLQTALDGKTVNSTGFLEHFDDSARWANGSAITHNSTNPIVGNPWKIHIAGGSAPTVINSNEGLTPANGDSLFYLGSDVNSVGGKMTLAVDLSPVATDAYAAGTQDFGLNISFSNLNMLPSGGGIAPAGVVHISMNSLGVTDCSFYGGAALTCLTRAAVSGVAQWNTNPRYWPDGIRQRIVYQVDGDYLRITAVGHGSLLFYHANLSDLVGVSKTNFWIEPSGTVAPGALSFTRKIVIHRVSDNPSDINGPSWGQSNRIKNTQLVIDGPNVAGPNIQVGSSWLTGSAPVGNESYQVSATGKFYTNAGFWCYPYASTAAYPAELGAQNVTSVISSTAGDSNTSRLGLPDFPVTVNGQGWECVARGTFAANGNNKELIVYLSTYGATLATTGTITENGTSWEIRIERNKLSATSHSVHATIITGGGVIKMGSYQAGATPGVQIRCTTPTATGDILIHSARQTIFLK